MTLPAFLLEDQEVQPTVSLPSKRQPPLHVLVTHWLRLGWDVDPAVVELAVQQRAAARLTVPEPVGDARIDELLKSMPKRARGYGRWLRKLCDAAPVEEIPGIQVGLTVGAHFVELQDYPDFRQALESILAWRLVYCDLSTSDAVNWGA